LPTASHNRSSAHQLPAPTACQPLPTGLAHQQSLLPPPTPLVTDPCPPSPSFPTHLPQPAFLGGFSWFMPSPQPFPPFANRLNLLKLTPFFWKQIYLTIGAQPHPPSPVEQPLGVSAFCAGLIMVKSKSPASKLLGSADIAKLPNSYKADPICHGGGSPLPPGGPSGHGAR